MRFGGPEGESIYVWEEAMKGQEVEFAHGKMKVTVQAGLVVVFVPSITKFGMTMEEAERLHSLLTMAIQLRTKP